MIETVVALLMFVNAEIKEARCAKKHGTLPYAASATRKDSFLNL